MFRDILSGSRVIFIGLVFFVLVVGGSFLYSWHVHRTTDAKLAETQHKVQPLVNKNETRTAANTTDTSKVDFEQAETSPEIDDSQMPDNMGASPIDETSEMLDMADAFLPDDFVSEETPTEEVPVSPFGFGPYPEVPADLPETIHIPWNWSQEMRHKFQDHLRDFELMTRVLIKLWNEGDHGFTGGEMQNGIVYPKYPDTVYVRYTADFEEVEDGFIESSSVDISAGHGVSDQDIEMIRKGETPPGIRVLDMDVDGINAYSFLNLK